MPKTWTQHGDAPKKAIRESHKLMEERFFLFKMNYGFGWASIICIVGSNILDALSMLTLITEGPLYASRDFLSSSHCGCG
jgi:hypothetical protein